MDKDNLGDVPSQNFREQLHELADWIADYRENIGTIPVAPAASAGIDPEGPAGDTAGKGGFERIIFEISIV